MGWDGDLVTTFFGGVYYVPPCSWPVPPCCFEAGYGPAHLYLKMFKFYQGLFYHMYDQSWNIVPPFGHPINPILLIKLKVSNDILPEGFYFERNFPTSKDSRYWTSNCWRLEELNPTWNCVSKLLMICVILTLMLFSNFPTNLCNERTQ